MEKSCTVFLWYFKQSFERSELVKMNNPNILGLLIFTRSKELNEMMEIDLYSEFFFLFADI